MFEYLKGNVVSIKKDFIVLDVRGIGFKIYYSDTSFFSLNNEYTIAIYYYVKEDDRSIYGFINEDERDLFLKLISVKGVGPKTAFNMLRSTDYSLIIKAIGSNDSEYLKGVGSIGIKISSQIVLELYNKYKENIKYDPILSESYNALRNFGFSNKEINYAFKNIKDYSNSDECVSKCLKVLAK